MIILIADDDRLARFSMKSMLGDILGDSGDVFLEAKDGAEMVEVCREHRPDIAFVDIKMPKLNGLESIGESQTYSEQTEYVIVSGYSDFAFAQQGIRLGVNEYLLKPVDAEELEKVVEKLREKIKRNKRQSNSRFQAQIMDAFNYYSVTGDIELHNDFEIPDGYRYFVFMLLAESGKGGSGKLAAAQKRLLGEVSRVGEEIIGRKGYYAIAADSVGTVCIVFSMPQKEEKYVISQMTRLSGRSFREGALFHYMLWFAASDVKGVCSGCEGREDDLSLLIQQEPGGVYRHDGMATGEQERRFCILIRKMTEAWQSADGIVCRDILNSIWREFGGADLHINLRNIAKYCSFVTGCDIKCGSLKEFCRSFVEYSDSMYETAQQEDVGIVEKIRDRIRKNYMSDLSIAQIADELNLTANYVSTLFHQKTGMRFIDCLTETRIEAAKKLLVQNITASVQDIALMVGYNSARHFSTLFQKTTGMTPSAYRRDKVSKG